VGEELDDETLAFAHRMFDLARSGDTGALAGFVDAGLPVDLCNDKGDTLLILAAYHDHPDTVRALLERGAEAAAVNDRGQTALAAAVFRQSDEEVDILLGGGADPALGSPSALEVARFFELPAMVERLGSYQPIDPGMPLNGPTTPEVTQPP
jgi:ankyrin repeat protein